MGRKTLAWRMLALVAVLALVIAACSSGETTDDTTADSSGTTAASGEVPNPDVLVVTVNDDVFNLDPAAVNENDVGQNAILNVYDRLVAIPPDSGSPVPSLATEVPTVENGLLSEDGLTYTFTLQEGVTFSDGTDLTAEDVKYSWDRVVEMNLPEGQATLFENVAETRVVDDLTFEVTLNQVDAAFLGRVAAGVAASVVSPDAVDANGGVVADTPNEYMAQNMVGTGPYTLASWERGDRMTFDINADYWGEPAHLPVRWELIVDSPATGLQAKEYDIVDISPTDVPSIEPIEHAVVDDANLDLQVLQIGMNMNIAEGALPEGDTIPLDFFQDVRVRQAFNYAFDYEGYIAGILGGLGGRNSFVLPTGMFGYDPDAPIYETDAAMAEQLFTEAGLLGRGLHDLDHQRPDPRGIHWSGADPQGQHRGTEPQLPRERAGGAGGTVRRGTGYRPAACGDVVLHQLAVQHPRRLLLRQRPVRWQVRECQQLRRRLQRCAGRRRPCQRGQHCTG